MSSPPARLLQVSSNSGSSKLTVHAILVLAPRAVSVLARSARHNERSSQADLLASYESTVKLTHPDSIALGWPPFCRSITIRVHVGHLSIRVARTYGWRQLAGVPASSQSAKTRAGAVSGQDGLGADVSSVIRLTKHTLNRSWPVVLRNTTHHRIEGSAISFPLDW